MTRTTVALLFLYLLGTSVVACNGSADNAAGPESRERFVYEGTVVLTTPIAESAPGCGVLNAVRAAGGFVLVERVGFEGQVDVIEEGIGCATAASEAQPGVFVSDNWRCRPAVGIGYGAIGVTSRDLSSWRMDTGAGTFVYEGLLKWVDPQSNSGMKSCIKLEARLAPSTGGT